VRSIDALRGFDMFWIMGADDLAVAILNRSHWTLAPALTAQLEHAAWEGFRFYDLIFPLFLFLVGCVLPYSLDKYRATPNRAYARIARRAGLLVLLGLICNGLLNFNWPDLRVSGVLQRIGICYGVAALIVLQCRVRGQVAAAIGILLTYWALLALVPAPGGVAGDLARETNLAGYLDRLLLPGKILEPYYGFGDNEGLLSTVPAIATTLLGALAGQWLKSSAAPWRKVGGLAAAGCACLASGYAWSFAFPIIKNLWTSSFVLVAGGWSLLLLALFYAVIDVLGWHRWAFFWIVIGANAITIYVVPRFLDFAHATEFFLGGTARLCGTYGTIVLLAGTLLAKWLFLWWLYRQRVFLRV
jgi:predicted acyltransferase